MNIYNFSNLEWYNCLMSRNCTLKTKYSGLFGFPPFQLLQIPIRDWNLSDVLV